MYYFYILLCADGSFYCGSTKDLQKREKTHNSGKGSIYVRTHGGGQIVYSEELSSQSEALRREIEVKKWTKQKKNALIKSVLK